MYSCAFDRVKAAYTCEPRQVAPTFWLGGLRGALLFSASAAREADVSTFRRMSTPVYVNVCCASSSLRRSRMPRQSRGNSCTRIPYLCVSARSALTLIPGSHSIVADAFEVHADPVGMSKPSENVLHRFAPCRFFQRFRMLLSACSRVPRPVPITSRLVFENQTILSRGAMRSLADFEHKTGWVAGHHGRTTIRKVSDKGGSYVVGFSDVDPLASVRESIDTRSGRCEHPDASLRKNARNMLLKRHP